MPRKVPINETPSRNFGTLPDDAYIRLPAICELYGISRNTVYRRVKDGGIPSPRKLSERVTAWRVGDIRADLARRAAV